jgi:hypothetical protein
MTLEHVQTAEAQAIVELAPKLQAHLALTADAFTLIAELVAAVPEAPMKDLPPPLHVATKLLLRLSNDLRGIDLLAMHGYPLQACALGASAYEVAFTIGYIGGDHGRAQVWLNHNDPTGIPWDVQTMTRDTFATLGVPDPQTQTAAAYRVYRQCCMAKHGNPFLEGRFGLQVGDGRVVMSNGPDVSEQAVRVARFALELAAGAAAVTAMMSFLRHYLSRYVPPAAFSRFVDRVNALRVRLEELDDAAIAQYGNDDPFPGRW